MMEIFNWQLKLSIISLNELHNSIYQNIKSTSPRIVISDSFCFAKGFKNMIWLQAKKGEKLIYWNITMI